MQRRSFLRALIATVGVTELVHLPPAHAAGIDELALGNEVFAQLREDGEMFFDSTYYEHLNEVGSIIAETARPRYPYPIRYYIVRGDSANAFAVPGGNIYVNEALLKLTKNRDELAGVLAHETGHMVLHHVAKRIANQNKANVLGSAIQIVGAIFGGWVGADAAGYLSSVGAASQDAHLSQHIEAQADEEGARIIAASKQFNPYGLIWFFEIMSATYGPGQKGWLMDHPLDQARIDDLRNLITNDPALFGMWKDTQQKDQVYW
ncbi:MAG: M48 family metalloprotease [Candidatus Velthaea sp.]|jgi:predicted Zn-dependent protease